MATVKEENNEKKEFLLTLQETCQILKCHPNTLRKWDKEGVLIAIRFGRRKDRRYKRSQVMAFIQKMQARNND